jgi:hypothetical protein
MEKKRLLVSFSGGETSAYILMWLWMNKRDEFDMHVVFANTGQENEETLLFVKKCQDYFNIPIVWVEAIVHHGSRTGTTHKIVSYETASRNGEPFEEAIKKYMIPNLRNFICTRELKLRPIQHYSKSIGWKRGSYYTAIGIRSDEIDRVSKDRKKDMLIYPLVEYVEKTKIDINTFWNSMPFRLNLKGYQGNCKTCWKKSWRKLGTIAVEHPEHFDFFRDMETKYSHYISEGKKHNTSIIPPLYFFRGNKSVDYIFNTVVTDPNFKKAGDDASVYHSMSDGQPLDISNGCEESCEVF